MTGNNIMVDLETMGNTHNSAIIAIGAVRFNSEVMDEFYTVVNLQSSVDAGLSIDPSTVLWWMQQSDSARAQFEHEGVSISNALALFSKWIGEDAIVWGNGAAFDNVILANAYKKVGLPTPWKFWNDRCYRTIKALYPEVQIDRKGTYHNALDDARNQASHLIAIMEKN